MVRSWISNSGYRKDWPLRMIHRHILTNVDDPTLGVLGLAYKENTNSVKNSPSLRMLRSLSSVAIRTYDPAVSEIDDHSKLTRAHSAIEAAEGVDGRIIKKPWAGF